MELQTPLSFSSKIFLNLSLSIISIFIICIKVSAEITTPPTIKIGYITDLSGGGAFFGVQSQRGATLALEDINKQPNDSLPKIKILFEDTKGSAPQAVTAVIKLLDQENVSAIVCDLTSICTSISQKVKQAKKILIYHSPSKRIREQNPYAFRNFMDYTIGCNKVAKKWKEKGNVDIYSIMANGEFGELCEAGAKEAADLKETINYNAGDDLRTVITMIKSRSKDSNKEIGILFTGYEPDYIGIFKLLSELKVSARVGFPDIALTKNLIEVAKDNIANIELYGFEKLDSDFLNKVETRFKIKDEPNMQGVALAYNAINNLYNALSIAPTLSSCDPKDALSCEIKLLETPKSKLLGFKGFVDGGDYPIVLNGS